MEITLLAWGCAGEARTPPKPPRPTLRRDDAVAAGEFGTGVGLADLDGDAAHLADLVLASGNDMDPGPVTLFAHAGPGKRPFGDAPAQRSEDRRNFNDTCLGDVDGNGFVDVAVVRAWDEHADMARGGVDVFLNHGGVLSGKPDVTWSVGGYVPYACDFGDVDGDGRLDLGVAVLWDRGGINEGPATMLKVLIAKNRGRLRVYRNLGTGFDPSYWQSAGDEGFMGLSFDDVDGDGDLDLVAVGRRVQAFFSEAGKLPAEPGFRSRSRYLIPYGLDVARRDDGSAWIVVSTGCEYPIQSAPGCVGQYVAYDVRPSDLAATPTFATARLHNPGPVLLHDLDGDRHPELVGGSWGRAVVAGEDGPDTQRKNEGGPLYVYRGSPAGPSRTPCLASEENLVSQYVAAGSARPGLATEERETRITAAGGGALVDLGDGVSRITAVTVDGVEAPWAWTPEHDWVSVGGTRPGAAVVVRWLHREARDLVVGNWKGAPGGALLYLQDADFAYDCDGIGFIEPSIEGLQRIIPADADPDPASGILHPALEDPRDALPIGYFPGL
ncbi:MAG: FG-GAP repeat domain-containing protein [Myxococcota bacterium]